MGVQVPRQAPFARVTELVYVSGPNPDAERRVSSTLTSRTIPGWCNGSTIGFDPVGRGSNPLLGTTWFHSQVGQGCGLQIRDRPFESGWNLHKPGDVRRLWHQFRKLWVVARPWGSAPPPGARYHLQCCQSGNGSAWKAAAWLKSQWRFVLFTLRHLLDDVRRLWHRF